MARAGADAICVACTEFSLMAETLSAPTPILDALDLLDGATVRFVRGEKPLPPRSAPATAVPPLQAQDEDRPALVRHRGAGAVSAAYSAISAAAVRRMS